MECAWWPWCYRTIIGHSVVASFIFWFELFHVGLSDKVKVIRLTQRKARNNTPLKKKKKHALNFTLSKWRLFTSRIETYSVWRCLAQWDRYQQKSAVEQMTSFQLRWTFRCSVNIATSQWVDQKDLWRVVPLRAENLSVFHDNACVINQNDVIKKPGIVE